MRAFKTAFPAGFLNGYQEGTMKHTHRGVPCLKNPIDMAIYQRVIWDLRPGTLIEIGSRFGGGALFFADVLTGFGMNTHVYSIDLEVPEGVRDQRITFIEGDVHDLGATFGAQKLYEAPHPWLVIEDSAHTYDGCMAALEFFAGKMKSGDMLIIEDGVLVDLGLRDQYDGGPNYAIEDFFKEHPYVYEIDFSLCDTYGENATYNPNGYLRKR